MKFVALPSLVIRPLVPRFPRYVALQDLIATVFTARRRILEVRKSWSEDNCG
jgi:hypothetical protein